MEISNTGDKSMRIYMAIDDFTVRTSMDKVMILNCEKRVWVAEINGHDEGSGLMNGRG